ncbi:MAG TPA: hypothetical protein VJQ82_16165 [Terriglobales bacterium]|nr:hypothetical protein [Terriglobales bacterium]
MGLFDSFRKEEVAGTKVLVCALDARFGDAMNSDSNQYRRIYPATTANVFSGVEELKQAIAQPYDIVHFYGDVSQDGKIAGISGEQFVDLCCNANVKLLWIASDNKSENYVKGFPVKGKKVNLVMTIRRLGPYFPLFLGNLLERMNAGEPMPSAWVALNPQRGDSVQPDTPECVFMAGRGKVVLKA